MDRGGRKWLKANRVSYFHGAYALLLATSLSIKWAHVQEFTGKDVCSQ